MNDGYDAVLVLSFGGPESREEVLPFLENVTRGRGIPRERLLEVAEHYYHFGGRSPINDQNRALAAALDAALASHGPRLPVYWGNRNWHPFLAGTLRRMQADGVRRAIAFATSAFGSYAGCRQYQEDLGRAAVDDLDVHKLPPFHDHPLFVSATVARVREAMRAASEDARLVFTAHSIPESMAATSPYVRQLQQTCALVAEQVGRSEYDLVYQSRSGPPSQPWLGPDICDHLRTLAARRVSSVVVMPVGFLSDHLEVLYDLDTEAAAVAEESGVTMLRAATVGTHPGLVEMIRQMVQARVENPEAAQRDLCPVDCCPPPRRPTAA